MVGLDDLRGLFQPMILRFYDSMKVKVHMHINSSEPENFQGNSHSFTARASLPISHICRK